MYGASNTSPRSKISSSIKLSARISKPVRQLSAGYDLSALQSAQHHHDQRYHQDIWCLPFNARIKHMVLHFSKYTGRFISADEAQDHSILIATLIDTMIITLASANMLNLKLASLLGLEKTDKPNLRSIGKTLAASEFSATKNPHQLAAYQLGKIAGRMAKACESLDHMEAFDSRNVLEKGVLDISKLCLALAALLDLDLIPLIHTRWEEVEAKSIF